jgi:uncharacterized protein YndB with AHSA1/START domain
MQQGELIQQGGRWQLRFTRQLPHPPDKVWRAITEPEHLEAWFPQRVVGEWKVGAPLKFLSQYGDFDGEVIAVDPKASVEFRWGTDIIRLEIAPHGQGTTLTLLDTIDQVGKAARDSAGWHECLDRLDDHLNGVVVPTARQGWKQLHAGYMERFGPEASTIGPPAEIMK